MRFIKAEMEQETSWIKRIWANPRWRKTFLYALGGAVLGFVFYFLTEGLYSDAMPRKDIIESVILGVVLGVFIVNSPCTRGRC